MIDLQRIWPFALVAVVGLALIILTLLLLLLRRSARVSKFEDAEPEPEPMQETPAPAEEKAAVRGPAPLAMRLAFNRAGRRLDRAAAGNRHRVPLLLLLGAEGSRDSDLFANAGLELPFGAPAEAGTDLGLGRGFWFLDRGVVLDLAGDTVLSADGRSADERSWRSSLHLLQKLRPKRPVDGVVLTVNCRELIEAQRNEAAQEELSARAGRIYRRLWQMQQRLGFRLPVYLLVTGCERLSGFGSFSGLVPSDLRDEMLGWSSPFGPDAAYRSGWVDEAFNAVGKRMDDLQMEMFSDKPAAAESLFLLPGAVRSLNQPVRAFLDQLFKPSAYHESLILRGIYFCGREEEAPATPAEAANVARRTFFVKDILNEKAFRESALAIPAARTVIARNRAVRLAQAATAVAALLLGGGLLWASYNLRHQAGQIEDFLGDTLAHLRQMRQADAREIADAELKDWTLDLLHGMARMDFGYFGSAFIPSSWFSPFHDRVRQAFTRSFEEIILQAIRHNLEDEARSLTAAAALREVAPVLAVSPDTPVQPIDRIREFADFQRYVREMAEVEKKGDLFNRLPESRDLQPLGELVRFTFRERMPESFYQNNHIYLAALRKASYPPFDPALFRTESSSQAVKLAESFFAALYRRNPFMERLDHLAGGLLDIAVQQPEGSDTKRFQDLVDRMEDVQAVLNGSDLEWAFQSRFNLGPDFAGALAVIEGSDIFDPASARRIRDIGASGWERFRRDLATADSLLTGGPLLSVRDGHAEMQLSEQTVFLQGALRSFLRQGFVAADSAGSRIQTELAPGTRLVWDEARLDKATAVTAAFVRFREKGMMHLHEELRPTLEAVARARTEEQVVDLIESAQTFPPVQRAVSQRLVEDEVRVDIGAFAAATRPVNELMTALGSIQLNAPRRDLEAATSSEANRLLRSVDRLLEEENAYEPKLSGFSWWDGIVPASPAAWDVDDQTGVQVYLENTRTRIANLADVYAQPLLTWLTKTSELPHETRILTEKWKTILDDLRNYEAKKPGNPVVAMEDYILSQMPKVTTESCKAAELSLARTGDSVFANSLLDLSRKLSSHCYFKASEHVLKLYQDAAVYFNQRLAGRYPFTSRPPGPSVPEADPEDVRAFFRLFDKCKSVFDSVPERADQEGMRSARPFMERMTRARAFFKPYLDAEKPEPYPSFDVEAAFRILREREVAANQIIGWSLDVGGERVTDRETENRKIRWTLGEPVKLSLRWASDAPFMPVLPKGRAGVSVQERTVVYEYRNRWALLAALSDNRVTLRDLPAYADEQPVTLALAVYTQEPGGPVSEVPTQVFLRLTVLAPGTTQVLDPPSFPERAPLGEKAAVEENVL